MCIYIHIHTHNRRCVYVWRMYQQKKTFIYRHYTYIYIQHTNIWHKIHTPYRMSVSDLYLYVPSLHLHVSACYICICMYLYSCICMYVLVYGWGYAGGSPLRQSVRLSVQVESVQPTFQFKSKDFVFQNAAPANAR